MCFESEKEQKTVSEVPGYLKAGGELLVDKATKLATDPFEAFTGDRVAGFSDDMKTAFQKLRDMISGAPQVGEEALTGARNYAAAPAQQVSTERVVDEDGKLGAISDYVNPYAEQALQPSLDKIFEASDAARKRINAGSTSSGAFGDARHGILEASNDRDTAKVTGDTASKFMMDAFNNAMGLRTGDLNRFGATDAANAEFEEKALQRELEGTGALETRASAEQARMLQQIQSLLSSGTVQQGNEQAGLDAIYQDFIREYGHDFSVLDALGGALGSAPYSKTQTTTSSEPDNSGLGALGSAAGAFAGSQAGSAALASMLAMI